MEVHQVGEVGAVFQFGHGPLVVALEVGEDGRTVAAAAGARFFFVDGQVNQDEEFLSGLDMLHKVAADLAGDFPILVAIGCLFHCSPPPSGSVFRKGKAD